MTEEEVALRAILAHRRFKAEIAVEGMLINHRGSSRLTADAMVDAVIRIMDGEEVDAPKPWQKYAVKL